MKKLTEHLQYNWWKYLALPLASILLWSLLFSAWDRPDSEKTVVMDYFGSDMDAEGLNEMLSENASSISHIALEQILLNPVTYPDGQLYQLLQTRPITSDLLILQESQLESLSAENCFPEIPADALEAAVGRKDLDYFIVDGKIYGIYLDVSAAEPSRFSAFYKGTERCIAFFSPYSENLYGLYGTGDTANGAAMDVLLYLLEEA